MNPNIPLRRTLSILGLAVLCASLLSAPTLAEPQAPLSPTQFAREVNNAILAIPFLSIFDNIEFEVRGSEVVLRGQVVLPATKDDAVNAVKHIEGVSKVVDQIEVLPVAPMDQQIRRAEYRAIYRDPALERYAIGALPPIHIIVNRGHVTLEGIVDNPTDKNIAYQRALSVTSALSVTNHLQVRHP